MAKQSNTTPETVSAEAPAAGDFPLSLDEFCQRLSASDSRVGLIGAFHHVESAAGRVHDTSGNFTARFEAFVNQPA